METKVAGNDFIVSSLHVYMYVCPKKMINQLKSLETFTWRRSRRKRATTFDRQIWTEYYQAATVACRPDSRQDVYFPVA